MRPIIILVGIHLILYLLYFSTHNIMFGLTKEEQLAYNLLVINSHHFHNPSSMELLDAKLLVLEGIEDVPDKVEMMAFIRETDNRETHIHLYHLYDDRNFYVYDGANRDTGEFLYSLESTSNTDIDISKINKK